MAPARRRACQVRGARKKRKSNKKDPAGGPRRSGSRVQASLPPVTEPSAAPAAYRGRRRETRRPVPSAEANSASGAVRRLPYPFTGCFRPTVGFASGHVRCGTTRHLRRQTPTCKSVRVRYLRRDLRSRRRPPSSNLVRRVVVGALRARSATPLSAREPSRHRRRPRRRRVTSPSSSTCAWRSCARSSSQLTSSSTLPSSPFCPPSISGAMQRTSVRYTVMFTSQRRNFRIRRTRASA